MPPPLRCSRKRRRPETSCSTNESLHGLLPQPTRPLDLRRWWSSLSSARNSASLGERQFLVVRVVVIVLWSVVALSWSSSCCVTALADYPRSVPSSESTTTTTTTTRHEATISWKETTNNKQLSTSPQLRRRNALQFASEPRREEECQHQFEHSSGQKLRSRDRRTVSAPSFLQRCVAAAIQADVNHNAVLEYDEYAQFLVTLLHDGNNDASISLSLLPEEQQESWWKEVTKTTSTTTSPTAVVVLDISAAANVQAGTPVSTLALLQLQWVCSTTEKQIFAAAAAQSSDSASLTTTAAEPLSPSAASTSSLSSATLNQCWNYLFEADSNHDELLTPEEYMLWINDMASQKWSHVAYIHALPTALQENFQWISTTSTAKRQQQQQQPSPSTRVVLISGIELLHDNQRARVSDTDLQHLQWICEKTVSAVAVAIKTDAAVAPPTTTTTKQATSSQQQQEQQQQKLHPKTFQQLCVTVAASADVDLRNSLNQTTFVHFVQQLATISGIVNLTMNATLLSDLPFPLQDLFEQQQQQSTTGGNSSTISIVGAHNLASATMPQKLHLDDFCGKTELALTRSIAYVTMSPTLAPSQRQQLPGQDDEEEYGILQMAAEATAAPTLASSDWAKCKTGFLVSDANRDNWLDTADYYKFVNFLVTGQWSTGAVITSYDTLPGILQSNFQTLAQPMTGSGVAAINVTGSKPGVTPSADELARLQQLCLATQQSIVEYKNNPNATSSNASGSNTTLAPALISQTDFDTCKRALLTSDTDRNSFLTENEFITFLNRLSGNAFTDFTFASLPTLLQTAFSISCSSKFSTSGGLCDRTKGVDVVGSKPNDSPTATQTAQVQAVCVETMQAIQEYLNSMTPVPGSNTVAPVVTTAPTMLSSVNQSTAAPTSTGTVSESYLTECRTALVSSDINRNNQLDNIEYVAFVNAMETCNYASFDSLPATIQAAFTAASMGNQYIDILAAQPGQSPTADQLLPIQALCWAMSQAASCSSSTISPLLPTGAPTAPGEMSPAAFQDCKGAMLAADLNTNNLMEKDEYARFAGSLNTLVSADGFDSLNPVLQATFAGLANGTDFFSVNGSKPWDTPSDSDTEHIKWICLDTYKAIAQIQSSSVPPITTVAPTVSGTTTLSKDPCFRAITAADVNRDGELTKEEYPAFLNQMSSNKFPGASFDSLPFILRDNFEWLKWTGKGGDAAHIESLEGDEASLDNVSLRFHFLCTRTEAALQAASIENAPQTMTDQCTQSLKTADANADNALNQTEYVTFVNNFSAMSWANIDNNGLDPALQEHFNLTQSSSGRIAIPGPTTQTVPPTGAQDGDPYSLFCSKTEKALASARRSFILFAQCRMSLTLADGDTSHTLDETEYVAFVYDMLEEKPPSLVFGDLDPALQGIYTSLKVNSTSTVDISGAGLGRSPTAAEKASLMLMCSKTASAVNITFGDSSSLPPLQDLSKRTVTVFNGFIVSNDQGMDTQALRSGPPRRTLDKAYSAFVNNVVGRQVGSRLRGRRLELVELQNSSPVIYQIDPTNCLDLSTNNTCQVVYASFQLVIKDESDPKTIFDKYTNITQDAIKANELQKELLAVDPQTPLDIVGSPQSLQPPGSPTSPFPVPAEQAKENRKSFGVNIDVMALAGACGLLALIIGFLIIWKRKNSDESLAKPIEIKETDPKEVGGEHKPGEGQDWDTGMSNRMLETGAKHGVPLSDPGAGKSPTKKGKSMFGSMGMAGHNSFNRTKKDSGENEDDEEGGGFDVQDEFPSERVSVAPSGAISISPSTSNGSAPGVTNPHLFGSYSNSLRGGFGGDADDDDDDDLSSCSGELSGKLSRYSQEKTKDDVMSPRTASQKSETSGATPNSRKLNGSANFKLSPSRRVEGVFSTVRESPGSLRRRPNKASEQQVLDEDDDDGDDDDDDDDYSEDSGSQSDSEDSHSQDSREISRSRSIEHSMKSSERDRSLEPRSSSDDDDDSYDDDDDDDSTYDDGRSNDKDMRSQGKDQASLDKDGSLVDDSSGHDSSDNDDDHSNDDDQDMRSQGKDQASLDKDGSLKLDDSSDHDSSDNDDTHSNDEDEDIHSLERDQRSLHQDGSLVDNADNDNDDMTKQIEQDNSYSNDEDTSKRDSIDGDHSLQRDMDSVDPHPKLVQSPRGQTSDGIDDGTSTADDYSSRVSLDRTRDDVSGHGADESMIDSLPERPDTLQEGFTANMVLPGSESHEDDSSTDSSDSSSDDGSTDGLSTKSSSSSDDDLSEANMSQDETIVNSVWTAETGDGLSARFYRTQIEALVMQVVPDEIDNVDAMMEQFVGREEELLATLRNMAVEKETTETGEEAYDNATYNQESCGEGSYRESTFDAATVGDEATRVEAHNSWNFMDDNSTAGSAVESVIEQVVDEGQLFKGDGEAIYESQLPNDEETYEEEVVEDSNSSYSEEIIEEDETILDEGVSKVTATIGTLEVSAPNKKAIAEESDSSSYSSDSDSDSSSDSD